MLNKVRKKGILLINEYPLSSLGTLKSEIFEEVKKSNYKDLEDVVYRYQLTYIETIDVSDLKLISTATTGYTLPPGMYKINDNKFMLKS